jgi:curved DNA-binding protein CbpA
MKDYYRILGVHSNASTAQIKRAYRDLVKQFHPDINQTASAGDRTRELNEAWAVLADPESRMAHDLECNLPVRRPETPTAKPSSTNGSAGNSPAGPPVFCCEECGRSDATVRASVNGRAYTFINFSKKPPSTRILCVRCREREPLGASAVNVFFGWCSRKL